MENPTKELVPYLISTAKAVKRHKNYLGRQCAVIKQDLKINETESVWYPLQVIKDYIAYLEKIMEEHDCDIDGLRFYFSAYERGLETPGNRDYKNRMSFFAMPTEPSGKSNAEIDAEFGKGSSFYEFYKHNSVYFKDVGNGKFDPTTIDPATADENIVNMDTNLNEGHAKPPPPFN